MKTDEIITTPVESVDAKNAMIFWDLFGGKVTNVLVVDRSGLDRENGNFDFVQRYSGGCVYADWLNPKARPEDLPYLSIEGTWAKFMWFGFVDRDQMDTALFQFSKIRECLWAKKMVKALDELAWSDEP